MDFINLPILLFSLLLSVSILTSLVSLRIGIPLILMFLCIGLVVGEGGFALLDEVRHPRIAFFIGSLALALILFDSGFHTQTKNYRQIVFPSFLLATVGVVLTALFLAPVAKEVLMVGWIPALLLASVISSTDSAAVFFLLRSNGIALREKVKSTLEVESGSNDPMAIFLTLAFITLAQMQIAHEPLDTSFLFASFAEQLLIGLGFGSFMGLTMRTLINKTRLEQALYPIFVVSMALMGFAITNMLGGSGFLAIYIAGLIVGNSKIQAYIQISKFQQTLTWLSQITMFIALGLFVSISSLNAVLLPGFLIGFALIFIARPAAVMIVLSFFKTYSFREKLFISSVGLRGATSILLALAPIVYSLPHAGEFFDIIFVMVLFSLSFQGFLIPHLAKWCGISVPLLERPPEKMQIDLPGLPDSSLITYDLHDTTPAVLGQEIPKWAMPTLIIRNGIAYTPTNIHKLKSGDKIYVFAYSDSRRPLLDSLYGGGQIEDATGLLGDFPIAPSTTFGELEKMYGIHIEPRLQNMTIEQLLRLEFDDFEVGDRLSLDTIELVVRSVENGTPTGIGLDIDPTRGRSFYARTRAMKMINKTK